MLLPNIFHIGVNIFRKGKKDSEANISILSSTATDTDTSVFSSNERSLRSRKRSKTKSSNKKKVVINSEDTNSPAPIKSIYSSQRKDQDAIYIATSTEEGEDNSTGLWSFLLDFWKIFL